MICYFKHKVDDELQLIRRQPNIDTTFVPKREVIRTMSN